MAKTAGQRPRRAVTRRLDERAPSPRSRAKPDSQTESRSTPKGRPVAKRSSAPDKLGRYVAKRNFAATPEPKGKRARAKGHRFCVQKHDARRLHFDLRLELDGVLKSWAVTRGPSLVPGEKRLAVHTEDHPLEYLTFEGVIPKGEYGAGPVIVWDRGSYENLRDEPMEEALEAGHASFRLDGEKLHGGWSLRRIQGRRWLLVKRRDEDADSGDPVADRPESVVSGRTIEELGE
jgi:bifunctional non-homologous end joining protein LigD